MRHRDAKKVARVRAGESTGETPPETLPVSNDLNTARRQWERFTEFLLAQAPLHTFEGAVKSLEALCLGYVPATEPGTFPERPERETDPWYAQEILAAIRATRHLLGQGHPHHAAAEALIAGSLAGNWPAARRWRKTQEDRRRGGQAPKYLRGLQAAVDRLATEHPDATPQELWDLIPERVPESEDDPDPIGGFIVYRDGSKVVQVEDATGREKGIFFRSFGRYVTRARSK